MASRQKLGHGDHWLAVLDQADPRLLDVVATPVDAADRPTLHRAPLTESVDLVQVTSERRLVTAYPEPRATSLVTLRPRELALWSTGAEGWMVADHAEVGTLTIFLTDLLEHGARYQKAPRELRLELGGIGYEARPSTASPDAPSSLWPASRGDPRFLPDDYAFLADVLSVAPAGAGEVVDIAAHGGLHLPLTLRRPSGARVGGRIEGHLWLTGRLSDAG